MATQAPAKGKSRSTTPKASANGNGSGQTTAKPKEPKVYVFGGSLEAPQPGANCRRLWKFLNDHLSKKQMAAIKTELQKLQPEDDRFVRWQRLVEASHKAGIEQVTVGDQERKIGQALVRSLALEDKKGVMGRDASITIF